MLGVFVTLFFGLVARQTYRRHHFQQGLLAFAPGFESYIINDNMALLSSRTVASIVVLYLSSSRLCVHGTVGRHYHNGTLGFRALRSPRAIG